MEFKYLLKTLRFDIKKGCEGSHAAFLMALQAISLLCFYIASQRLLLDTNFTLWHRLTQKFEPRDSSLNIINIYSGSACAEMLP